ncbi:MAG TPA: hypothetical protein VMR81_07850 [Patescibacteria group bacterium]|nr:hypothetical protein [Patescibacteria group bacterium]
MPHPEAGSEYLNTFAPPYRAFFRGVLDGGSVDVDRLEEYARLMQKPDTLENIHSVADQLQKYSIPPEQAKHSEVPIGWKILTDFFEPKHRMLQRHGVVPLVYGSMIYDDVVNADFDLYLFGEQHVDYIQEFALYDWNYELIDRWQNRNEGHVTYHTVDQSQHDADLFRGDGHLDEIHEYASEIKYDAASMSIAFNGRPLFTEDASTHLSIQKALIEILQQEPLFAGLVLSELNETLKIRQRRRGILE